MTGEIDFTDSSGLIPDKTVATLLTRIKFCDTGPEGVLKPTKAGDAFGLDVEYVLLDGPYAKQKMFAFVMVTGATDGQKSMAERNKAMLKAVLDSAFFLDPHDVSPEARKRRTVHWRDFDGLKFLAEIGTEQGRDGYADKNVVARVITRDMPAWGGRAPIEQSSSPNGGGPSAAPGSAPQAAPIARPCWAQ
jgi:hypothetical protein